MKIPLPAKVKIGGHIYQVSSSQELTQSRDQGVICHRVQTMRVAGDLTPSSLLRTFIHESLHALNYVWLNQDLDEKLIGTFAEGLGAFLMDNFNIEGMTYDRTM